MNSLAFDIATILGNAGLGTVGTDIYYSKEPEQPDDCITVYNTGGKPEYCLAGTLSSEKNTFQVRVRSNKYLTGQTVIENVRTALELVGLQLTDSNGTTNYSFWGTGLPIDLQRDKENRAIVVMNFGCLRSQG